VSAAAAGGPQLQHLRTLRGHAGRVRTVAWLGSPDGGASDAVLTDSSSSSGGGSGLGTVLSGSEDQTVRAWTLDALVSAPAAAEPTAQQEATDVAATDATAAGHVGGESVQRLEAQQRGNADAVLSAGSGTAAAAHAAAKETEPPVPGQRPAAPLPEPTLQRSPSLCDGMSAQSGTEPRSTADDDSAMQQQQQQQQQPQEGGPASAEQDEQQSPQLSSSHRATSGSSELDTLSTVAAASPGRLRYGGLPPQQQQQGLSIARSGSSPCAPPVSSAVQQPQQGSPAAAAPAQPVVSAAAPAAGAAMPSAVGAPNAIDTAASSLADRSPAIATPSAAGGVSRRGRHAKAASLGARPLPLPVQSPKAAAAQLLQPAARDSALAACLQVSHWQRLGQIGAPDAEPAGSAAAGSDANDSSAAAEQLRSWGVFAGPLDAGAALQAAAAAVLEASASRSCRCILLYFQCMHGPTALLQYHYQTIVSAWNVRMSCISTCCSVCAMRLFATVAVPNSEGSRGALTHSTHPAEHISSTCCRGTLALRSRRSTRSRRRRCSCGAATRRVRCTRCWPPMPSPRTS
jgi:hypothetical protein